MALPSNGAAQIIYYMAALREDVHEQMDRVLYQRLGSRAWRVRQHMPFQALEGHGKNQIDRMVPTLTASGTGDNGDIPVEHSRRRHKQRRNS